MAIFGRARPPIYGSLEPAHAEICATLHASSFAHGWDALDFERLIAARTSVSDAACDPATAALVGFVLSRGAAGEAEILTMVVAAGWRRRGVGQALLARHITRLAERRCEALFLEVNEDNLAGRKLYAGHGFVEVGRRKAYYARPSGDKAADALILRRTIG